MQNSRLNRNLVRVGCSAVGWAGVVFFVRLSDRAVLRSDGSRLPDSGIWGWFAGLCLIMAIGPLLLSKRDFGPGNK